MRNFKNIDRLFQEKLKDFEVLPPTKMWDSIENQLPKTSKRRIFPIWAKLASIAALFIFFFSVGAIYFLPSSNLSSNILNFKTEVKTNDSTQTEPIILTKNKSESKVKNEELKNITPVNNIVNTPIPENNSIEIPNPKIDRTPSLRNDLNKYASSQNKNNNLKKATKENKSSKEFLNGKLSVATIYAPIYINSFGNGSGVDSQFKSNSTSGNSSYSYGFKVAYQLNNKFSVQSGVNVINLGYTTNDVYVTPGVAIVGFSNLSNIPLIDKGNLKSKNLDSSGDLNQLFGYVEIPIELKYNVTDGKFGLNLVGGFSTLLLNRDEVFIETNNFTQSLGASKNLRSVNFSGNFGIDVDYAIHKNLFINVSPMFKVQTNTFSKNSGSILPYYLGVYTGLNYKF